MPAHITHEVFATEVISAALGEDGKALIEEFGPFLTLGAQGPDIFYHNQRTKPSGLCFGKMLHHRHYGAAVRGMVECARARSPAAVSSRSAAFTLGFTTHAILDRVTHPFIIYHSGWVDHTRPETAGLHLCHAFYERILDVMVLHGRTGRRIETCDFLASVNCGPDLPEDITEGLVHGLLTAFPRVRNDADIRRKIRNAYLDSINFYRFTNPCDRQMRDLTKVLDVSESRRIPPGRKRRRLALFHPLTVPAHLDFLNEAHRLWVHPSFEDIRSTESFTDLYEAALRKAAPVIRAVADALRGEVSPLAVETAVGGENLNDGVSVDRPAPSKHSDPLPIPELIDDLYR